MAFPRGNERVAMTDDSTSVPHRGADYLIPHLVRRLEYMIHAGQGSSWICQCADCELLIEANAWVAGVTKDINGGQPPWEREEGKP